MKNHYKALWWIRKIHCADCIRRERPVIKNFNIYVCQLGCTFYSAIKEIYMSLKKGEANK